MRTLTRFFLVCLALCMISLPVIAQKKGPIVDKILFNARSSQDIGFKDVAEGKSDLWIYGSDGAAFKALPPSVTDKLDVYSVTGASMISLFVNSFPNQAPYTAMDPDSGKEIFNPFAIQEVRFSLNLLINRKKIIDEIMVGAGLPWFTPAIPTQPNSARYELFATKMGITAAGNEQKALDDIAAAMNKAAAASNGKLVKQGDWWMYNGSAVSIRFLIRVDDPTLRLPEGRYIADQIEKAGIKVIRLEWDRAKCYELWARSNPKDYKWNLYTEGWSGGQTYAFWDTTISQYYAPWYSLMPGLNIAGFWNYDNAEMDKLTQGPTNGRVLNSDEYYSSLEKAVSLGLKESQRIFVAAQTTYYAANKDRFLNRLIYGVGDGIDKWSMYTANVKPEKDGTKVLRMTGFSARGALFMSEWDPIGTQGFGDLYSANIIKEASDQELEANPVYGVMMPLRVAMSGMATKVIRNAKGDLEGKIAVPKDALLWNAKTRKWETGLSYLEIKNGDALTYDYQQVPSSNAYTTATFTLDKGKWHHGRPIDMNDYRYAIALRYDIAYKKGADDKVYEEEYAGSMNPQLIILKGIKFNSKYSMTVWGDANYPMSQTDLAQKICPTLMVSGSNYGAIVSWEVLEAVKGIVTEGSKSGTPYSYNTNENFTEVNLLNEKCINDLVAKLQEYAAAKRVPDSLKGFVTPDEAAKAYQMTIAFITAHKHGYISNGGFVLDSYDSANNTGVLTANRDPSYPFTAGYWSTKLATKFARIDGIKADVYKRGQDLKVSANISDVAFPTGTAAPATKANVTITLVGPKELKYTAKAGAKGTFTVTIPSKDIADLKPGSYIVIAEASLGQDSTASSTNLVVF